MTTKEIRSAFEQKLAKLYDRREIGKLFSHTVQHVTGREALQFRTDEDASFSPEESERMLQILEEVQAGRPYQQVFGEAAFYGTTFFVDENVLIPRPETEELLELAIEKIHALQKEKHLKILDIGTGSGVIPIILKKNFPEAEVYAIDLSEKALAVARRNAEKHGCTIHFRQADYLISRLAETYDVIISNPPYIGRDEANQIAESVKNFEPQMALFSPTKDALLFYRKIAADCKSHLKEGGLLFVEINQKLGAETAALFSEVLSEVYLLNDLSGNARFVWGRK